MTDRDLLLAFCASLTEEDLDRLDLRMNPNNRTDYERLVDRFLASRRAVDPAPDPLAPLRAAGVLDPQTCECGHPHAEHDADVNGCYCRVEGCDCGCHAAEAARRRADLAEVTRPSGSRLSQAARDMAVRRLGGEGG